MTHIIEVTILIVEVHVISRRGRNFSVADIEVQYFLSYTFVKVPYFTYLYDFSSPFLYSLYFSVPAEELFSLWEMCGRCLSKVS